MEPEDHLPRSGPNQVEHEASATPAPSKVLHQKVQKTLVNVHLYLTSHTNFLLIPIVSSINLVLLITDSLSRISTSDLYSAPTCPPQSFLNLSL